MSSQAKRRSKQNSAGLLASISGRLMIKLGITLFHKARLGISVTISMKEKEKSDNLLEQINRFLIFVLSNKSDQNRLSSAWAMQDAPDFLSWTRRFLLTRRRRGSGTTTFSRWTGSVLAISTLHSSLSSKTEKVDSLQGKKNTNKLKIQSKQTGSAASAAFFASQQLPRASYLCPSPLSLLFAGGIVVTVNMWEQLCVCDGGTLCAYVMERVVLWENLFPCVLECKRCQNAVFHFTDDVRQQSNETGK